MNRWLLHLAARSAWNRRFTVSLCVVCIALATLMLIGMERIRQDLRQHFTTAVSGVDLIVGARGGALPLLLYSVFHTGSPTGTFSDTSAQAIASQPGVAWAVPIAKGDSHRGFPVIGTTEDFFHHVRASGARDLTFSAGGAWDQPMHVVLGSKVAADLGYTPGNTLTLAHGDGALNAVGHDDHPFTVSGILSATGTPIDRTLLIRLEDMDRLHTGWIAGRPLPGRPSLNSHNNNNNNNNNNAHSERTGARAAELEKPKPPAVAHALPKRPTMINALWVGLERRSTVFSLQRFINTFKAEPLIAILPGVTLSELWTLLDPMERTVNVMAWMVAAVSVAGLISVLLASLNERRRELAILRSVGARPRDIVLLMCCESLVITLAGILLGALSLILFAWIADHWWLNLTGMNFSRNWPGLNEWSIVAGLIAISMLASLLPAWRAYRTTLSDGLVPR